MEGRADHPVVHVAHEDAPAYADVGRRRLPTEAEWEYAARGGLDASRTRGATSRAPGGRLANTWDGDFPWRPRAATRTAPVGSFPPNGFGLHDMAGNVWEWTDDWYSARHPDDAGSPCCAPGNPRGGERDSSTRPAAVPDRRKVIKGGSHLCAAATACATGPRHAGRR